MTKPFSQACENNKRPILTIISRAFRDATRVLEIGSGTGQHAVFFARHLQHLRWQPSDLPSQLAGVQAWLDESDLDNVEKPVALNVSWDDWHIDPVDAVFSANTFHIMDWELVERCMSGIGRYLQPGGTFCLYGPFNYGGRYTSDSNARFDRWLQCQDPASAIRNFEDVEALAVAAGLRLRDDHPMPANNRLVVWQKLPQGAPD